MPLHSDTRDRHSLLQQSADMRHEIGKSIARQDIVVIEPELRIGITAMSPTRHKPGDVGSEAIRVIVTVNHFIVQIILGKATLILRGKCLSAMFNGRAKLII